MTMNCKKQFEPTGHYLVGLTSTNFTSEQINEVSSDIQVDQISRGENIESIVEAFDGCDSGVFKRFSVVDLDEIDDT